MPNSKEWTEWHLTPEGWVKGDYRIDFQGVTSQETPSDRVATYRYNELIPAADLETWVDLIWKSDDEDAIDELLEQYGPCPEYL
jgi:hypothetical protein